MFIVKQIKNIILEQSRLLHTKDINVGPSENFMRSFVCCHFQV